MGTEIGAVGLLAAHPGLHVPVDLLARQRKLDLHRAVGGNLEEARIRPRLGEDVGPLGGLLDAVDLLLGAVVAPHHPIGSAVPAALNLDSRPSGPTIPARKREEDVAIGENPALARVRRMAPLDLPLGVIGGDLDDRRPRPANEDAPRRRRGRLGGHELQGRGHHGQEECAGTNGRHGTAPTENGGSADPNSKPC